MEPVGVANTRISTDYAQKSPRSLIPMSSWECVGTVVVWGTLPPLGKRPNLLPRACEKGFYFPCFGSLLIPRLMI